MNEPQLRVKILTIFPDIFPGPLSFSLIGNAIKTKICSLEIINIRDFGKTKHQTVDDEPFGGGHGMVMKPDVIGEAIDFALIDMKSPLIIYPTPRGKVYNQKVARELSECSELIFICGRFEGIDERILEEYNVRQICLGDFVLSGGELPVMVILDSVLRLVPGVLANQDTLNEESFNYYENKGTLLEYPQYTRPAVWRGREVPEILRSGNHKKINEWRLEKSLEITRKTRPDLL